MSGAGERERDGAHCRHRSWAGWGGSGRGGRRRRRRRRGGWRRTGCFRAARAGWGREASSDERIRNAQGMLLSGGRSRSPISSCPPDRQYNISRLLAHFVLSGSFTDCAVLGPPHQRIKGPPSPTPFSPRHESSKPPRLCKAQDRPQVHHHAPAQAPQDAQGWHQRGLA